MMVQINNWLRSPETLEYVKVVEEDLDLKPVESTHLEIHKSSLTKVVTSPLIVAKRGKGGGKVWGCKLMVNAPLTCILINTLISCCVCS